MDQLLELPPQIYKYNGKPLKIYNYQRRKKYEKIIEELINLGKKLAKNGEDEENEENEEN